MEARLRSTGRPGLVAHTTGVGVKVSRVPQPSSGRWPRPRTPWGSLGLALTLCAKRRGDHRGKTGSCRGLWIETRFSAMVRSLGLHRTRVWTGRPGPLCYNAGLRRWEERATFRAA